MNEDQKISTNNITVNQIKNISQHEKPQPKKKSQDITNELKISNFNDLIDTCNKKREIKLKHELENNVNLVMFSEGLIEISFNENLDKDFIKELSNKLHEWTGRRWIISLSKKKGLISEKQQEKLNKQKLFEEAKESQMYKSVLKIFPDADLIDIKTYGDKDE